MGCAKNSLIIKEGDKSYQCIGWSPIEFEGCYSKNNIEKIIADSDSLKSTYDPTMIDWFNDISVILSKWASSLKSKYFDNLIFKFHERSFKGTYIFKLIE